MTENNLEEIQAINPLTGLRRIHIENVQSVADLTLDFDKSGVYRLVGDNDVGKSAILRAINALFHNVNRSNYKEYISDWADTFVVEGWFYDGGYVKLSRGANDFYEWSIPESSNVLEKTDGKVPEELIKYFSLYTESDKSKLTLNFNLQGDVLPFVDTSASDNYWLTQKALGTNVLLNASKFLKKQNSDYTKDIKSILENIEYEKKISTDIFNEIVIDEEILTNIENNLSVIHEENKELEEIKTLKQLELDLISEKEYYANIPTLSERELFDLQKEVSEYNLLKQYFEKTKVVNESKEKFNKNAEKLKVFNEIPEVDSLIEELKLLKEFRDKLNLISNLKRNLQEIKQKEVKESDIKEIEKEISLNVEIKKYIDLLRITNANKSKVDALLIEINKVDSDIEQLKFEEKVCPVCGSDLMMVHTHK